jgi:hypothetical protein
MTVSIPNNASTTALAAVTGPIKSHAIWFQNFNTTSGIYLIVDTGAGATAAATEFYLSPATSATLPSSLIVQSSGGDTTLVNERWAAFQASGGALNLSCGRW